MQQQSILDQLKYRIKTGGATTRLIAINVAVFLLSSLYISFGYLFDNGISAEYWTRYSLWGSTGLEDTLYRPWSMLTNMFAHGGFLHLLGNMILLYFSGITLQRFFGSKKVWFLYIAGGLAGFFVNMAAHNIFPGLPDFSLVLGASGATTAMMIALASYAPQMIVRLFGVYPVKLYVIALVLIGIDILNLASKDGVAHFAHLGGALLGFLFIHFWKQGKDISKPFTQGKFGISNLFKRKPKLKVEYSKKRGETQDEAFSRTKKERQERIDAILDKIKYQGYGSLSAAEKEFLNNESRRV